MFGMPISRTITFGSRAAAPSTSVSPSAKMPTTSNSGSSIFFRASNIKVWSSARMTRARFITPPFPSFKSLKPVPVGSEVTPCPFSVSLERHRHLDPRPPRRPLVDLQPTPDEPQPLPHAGEAEPPLQRARRGVEPAAVVADGEADAP